MPFGSYQVSEESAVANAIRLVKEAGAEGVKLEGAGRTLTRISGIVEAGIPVMGHIGLTPQSATLLGGYRAQGRTAAAAKRLVAEAVALERAGCFSIVLEAIPAVVAARVTEAVRIPTIGIGAGPVMLRAGARLARPAGTHAPADSAIRQAVPRRSRASSRDALAAYARDVRSGAFPEEQHTYGMPDAERERFESQLTSKK